VQRAADRGNAAGLRAVIVEQERKERATLNGYFFNAETAKAAERK
jgi:hypothetical protein